MCSTNIYTATGRNGNGNTNDLYTQPIEPIDLGVDFKSKFIDCGSNHCCAVSTGNDSKCWGLNSVGQLGQGDTNNRGDQEGEMGDELNIIDLGSGFKIHQLSCGAHHTCAVSTNNTIKCFGTNANGELGYEHTYNLGDESGEMGDHLPTVDLGANFVPIQVQGGWEFSCALSVDSQVKCWGGSNDGRLGQGDEETRGASDGTMGDNLLVVDLGAGFNVTDIRCGKAHTCALSNNHEMKCWGFNWLGQLGLGDNEDRGDDSDEMGNLLPVVDLGQGFVPNIIATGMFHSLSISSNGMLKAWGYNYDGQLGYGDQSWRGNGANSMGDFLKIVDLGSNLSVSCISDGLAAYHTCTCLSADASFVGFKCFGANGDGELGVGDNEKRGDGANEMGDDLPFVASCSTCKSIISLFQFLMKFFVESFFIFC